MTAPGSLPPPHALHTTRQAAEALDVPAGLIRKWKHDGRIVEHGMVPAAVPGGLQPLYQLDELRPLAEAYHARRHARDT